MRMAPSETASVNTNRHGEEIAPAARGSSARCIERRLVPMHELQHFSQPFICMLMYVWYCLMSFVEFACLTVIWDILISFRFSGKQCDAMCLNKTAGVSLWVLVCSGACHWIKDEEKSWASEVCDSVSIPSSSQGPSLGCLVKIGATDRPFGKVATSNNCKKQPVELAS